MNLIYVCDVTWCRTCSSFRVLLARSRSGSVHDVLDEDGGSERLLGVGCNEQHHMFEDTNLASLVREHCGTCFSEGVLGLHFEHVLCVLVQNGDAVLSLQVQHQLLLAAATIRDVTRQDVRARRLQT